MKTSPFRNTILHSQWNILKPDVFKTEDGNTRSWYKKTNKRKMWCFKVSRSPEFKTKCQIIAFLIIWNVLFWICILINLHHYSSRKWCGSLFWQYKEISAFRSKYGSVSAPTVAFWYSTPSATIKTSYNGKRNPLFYLIFIGPLIEFKLLI